VPMEDLNLHFTGDLHAITAANNLLAAMIDAHLTHGNELGIDPLTISWRRCMDMNDRNLRNVITGLGGRAHGAPRETGFDITAASEVMALVAVARDLADLRQRLGAITIGPARDGEPVTAEQIRAAGAMAVILKDAIKPNLVQTLEGQPAFVHCGPFANIAHGNNSLVADRVALKLGEYVITESGFASDMGMEKFFDITCRIGDLRPDAVVLVATVRALKHHAGNPDGGLEAIETGAREKAETYTRSYTAALGVLALLAGELGAEGLGPEALVAAADATEAAIAAPGVEEIPIEETRGYVKRVLRSFAAYRLLYGAAEAPPATRLLGPAAKG